MTNRISIVIISFFIILSLLLSGCSLEPGSEFGIYLADTGELVISERDILSFDSEQMAFELNDSGIKRWNAFAPKGDAPKIADSLHTREFVIKMKGEELVSGKFWSLASSKMYSELVIVDSLFQKNQEFNKLFVIYGYPANPPGTERDTGAFEVVKEVLAQYFDSVGLLGGTSD